MTIRILAASLLATSLSTPVFAQNTPTEPTSLPLQTLKNVRVISVSPPPYIDSGIIMSWWTFAGVVDRHPVTFFSDHMSQETTPPPKVGQVCDVTYHIGTARGFVDGAVRDAWIISHLECDNRDLPFKAIPGLDFDVPPRAS